MKRTISILLLGLALVVSGCGGETTPPTSVPASGPTSTTAPGGTTEGNPTATTAAPAAGNGQATEVSFYYPVAVGGPVSKIIQGYADKFNTANPGIHVTPVFAGGYADVLTKIQTTLQGGGAPPEVAVLLSTDMQTLIDSDAIVPFDDYIKAAPDGQAWLNDFYPAFMANSQEDGHTYGIPFQRSTPVLYYNKDMFKAAGLDPATGPQTWDDLVAYGKKLTKLDSAGNGAPWGLEIPSDGFPYWLFQGFAIENGHNVVGDSPNKVSFNDPSTAEALQFFVDLSQKDNIMPKGVIVWNNTPTDFTGGKAAMIIHTTGSLTNILKTAKFDVGVSMLPKKQQFGAPTGGGNFYLFKQTDPAKRDAAWKFIQFMTTPEQAAQWSIDTGYIASRKAAYDTPAMKDYTAKTPQALVARDQLQYAAKELTAHNGAQIQKILGNAVQAAITGKKQPQAALDDAQKEADQLLSQFSK
jgi:sn-glycerol 3-phosphate transport system substrate-binding protein